MFLALTIVNLLLAQTEVYTSAENFGGKKAFDELMRNEMVYPKLALKNGEEGRVVLSFDVNSDGSIENILVESSVSPLVNREAIRLLKLLRWKPATKNDVAIDEKANLKFVFRIKKYLKLVKKRGYDEVIYPHTPVDSGFVIYQLKQLSSLPKPVFNNSDITFSEFIVQNLKYPAEAKKLSVSGEVKISFVVELSGRVSNVMIEHGVGAGCNEEAVRLLKMIKWYPGIRNGIAVRTTMKMSITFNVSNNENLKYVPSDNAGQM